MNALDLGARLRATRKSRHLSQQSVAHALNISRTAVSQLEAGKRSVSTVELKQFSEIYSLPVADLLSEEPGDERRDVAADLFLTVPELGTNPTTHLQVSLCLHLCREGIVLRRLMSLEPRSGPPVYEMRRPRTSGEAVTQGEHVARQERRRLGLGDAPISDVSELIISQGIWASGVTLPGDASGLFLRHPSIGLATLANSSRSKGWTRLSFAHEYAHALLDRNRDISISGTDNSSELVEQRANAFASAFLMPGSGIRAFLQSMGKGQPSRQDHAVFETAGGGCFAATQRPPARSQRVTYKDCAMLANHFGVTYRAATFRMKSLQHISDRECDAILDRERFGRMYLKALGIFSDVGKREQQQYRDRELRNEVAHLAIEARRRDKVSRARILELSKALRIPGDTLLNLAEAARGE